MFAAFLARGELELALLLFFLSSIGRFFRVFGFFCSLFIIFFIVHDPDLHINII